MSNPAQDEVDALFAQQDKKPSIHPEDAIHSGDHSDTESENETTVDSHDDDEDTLASQTTTAMPTAAYYIPNDTNFDANTGPKGVIADARSFEKARKRSFRQTLQAFSRSVLELPREKSSSPTSDLSTDEDEDEFMRTWRESRMQELQTAGSDIRTRRQSPSKRRFGNCDVVDALGYLDALDKLPPDTMVVVCIYDNEVYHALVYDVSPASALTFYSLRLVVWSKMRFRS